MYSNGYLRNGGNLDTATGSLDVKKGYGPGDIIRVKYEPKKGHLSFAINEEELEVAFINDNFKKAVYVPAVGALIEGSTYSLTLPLLED